MSKHFQIPVHYNNRKNDFFSGRVPAEAIGSTFDLPGSTVIIILPQANSAISFTWDSETVDDDDSSPTSSISVVADYIETAGGQLAWSPRKTEEKLRWIIGLGQSSDDSIEWKTRADLTDCDMSHPCTCLSFVAYEISIEGYLVEIAK